MEQIVHVVKDKEVNKIEWDFLNKINAKHVTGFASLRRKPTKESYLTLLEHMKSIKKKHSFTSNL